MEKLRQIIRENKMSVRPEFYSGRGAILCDLNGDQLEGIYQGVKKEYGDKAASNFVKMVNNIQVMSATTFLQELYNLCGNGWKYIKKKTHASGIAVQKGKNGEYDQSSAAHGIIGIFSAMSENRDETAAIKSYFLSRHGIKQKEVVWHHPESSNYYY